MKTKPTVILNSGEYLWGCQAAIIRQAQNVALDRKPRNNLCETIAGGLKKHVVGCLGELAFAKFIGSYATGMFDFRAADVAPNWEVKARDRSDAHLILQDDTIPDHRYVLLTTKSGLEFEICGWIWGKEALKVPISDKFNTGRPAIWISQDMLNPFD